MQQCKICNSETTFLFKHLIMNKYEIGYYQCNSCRFIQTEAPYWLSEAYQSAINNSDTGILQRNERFRRIVTVLLCSLFNKEEKFLDFAGGYGIFTRMMRDVGFDYYWLDEYAKNLISVGFEHKPNTTYEAITAFEVFEHLDNPIQKIEEMLSLTDTIIFSTELIGNSVPKTDWWYYAFSHGQHIAFYHTTTLEYIAKKYRLNLYSNGTNFHLLSKKDINPLLFKFLYKASKYGLYNFFKQNLHSKTIADNQVNKLNDATA